MTLQGTRIGAMDRRITLQTNTPTQNASGESVGSWADVATVWAQVIGLSATEQHEDDQEHATAQSEFRIRWRAGIDAGSRVLFDGTVYDITGVGEVGRRELLSLSAIARALP